MDLILGKLKGERIQKKIYISNIYFSKRIKKKIKISQFNNFSSTSLYKIFFIIYVLNL